MLQGLLGISGPGTFDEEGRRMVAHVGKGSVKRKGSVWEDGERRGLWEDCKAPCSLSLERGLSKGIETRCGEVLRG